MIIIGNFVHAPKDAGYVEYVMDGYIEVDEETGRILRVGYDCKELKLRVRSCVSTRQSFSGTGIRRFTRTCTAIRISWNWNGSSINEMVGNVHVPERGENERY